MSIRKRFGGTQAALVLAPAAPSCELTFAGRIGIVSCMPRISQHNVKCFRVLSFGHLSMVCEVLTERSFVGNPGNLDTRRQNAVPL